jgi:DNA-binding transcriptional regulator YiaG
MARKKKRIYMTGEEMRAIRLRLGMTQVQFARSLGKHVISVSNMERGKYYITESIAKLVRTLR